MSAARGLQAMSGRGGRSRMATPLAPGDLLRRRRCRRHALARARARGICSGPWDFLRLERSIARIRSCFETPEEDRHTLTVKRGRRRIRAVYDTRLGCLVTLWRQNGS